MSNRSLWVLCIVIFVPVACYFVMKYFSDKALVMPKHYIVDTVIIKTVNGQVEYDTVWHTIPDFTLTNQLGHRVSLDELHGKVIVCDFFFTHCPSFCPTLTRNMRELQHIFRNNDTIVQFLSFTVDPERDSVPVLKAYADHYGVHHDNWWFLTGPHDSIYSLIERDFKLAAQDTGHNSFVHTDRMVLLDTLHQIRGYYDGQDTLAMARLANDVVLLTLERRKGEKHNFFGDQGAP